MNTLSLFSGFHVSSFFCSLVGLSTKSRRFKINTNIVTNKNTPDTEMKYHAPQPAQETSSNEVPNQ
jgi:hypothetical protein